MKLVPLGDRVVLKQCRGRRDHKIRHLILTSKCTGETTGSRSNRCRTWRNGRWKRSNHAGKSG